MSSFRELIVWKKSYDLTLLVYSLTKRFPDDERYNLVSQIRRSAVSVPSNIAEGHARKSKKEFSHFLYIAYGSIAELETQLLLAVDFGYMSKEESLKSFELLTEVRKMLNGLLSKVSETN